MNIYPKLGQKFFGQLDRFFLGLVLQVTLLIFFKKMLYFVFFLQMGNLIYNFADANKNLTVFAPSNAAISNFPNDEKNFWTASTERMQFLIE